ncbi:hypothetical protein DTO006G1_5040 [Penicillium roqueforti]|nr:hypothetical protein CBS147337_5711 [Penicillium roqueforti]KAI2707537.1 hypothetical protein CBS147354_9465 [Penicillium roqueforti]KAI2760072.1 hypothetical protein DTO006G1_5040 [Penicillium roqueforti]KAI3093087.1 hypothetical protein CBS147333_10138 [Penicillium roqueforti]KAI3123579.1 hypothetical protein CBS147326_8617 [Penicillium roqueforti]
MVNVPNLDSDLSTSAEFASSASRTLYGIMDSFQSAPISVRELSRDLLILMRLLLVYQSAFEVTVASTHLRLQSFVGVESLESHKTRIKHAKSDIEDFVENLDYEICPHELKQLEEQRLGIDKCLEICTYSFDSIDLIQVKTEENGKVSEADKPTAFPGLYEKGSFSTINNYSTGDAVVFMVSTDERTIHGSNKMLGWRSRYLTGHVNDQSVQQISKDFALMNTGHLERKESSAGKSTYTSCALIFKCVK